MSEPYRLYLKIVDALRAKRANDDWISENDRADLALLEDIFGELTPEEQAQANDEGWRSWPGLRFTDTFTGLPSLARSAAMSAQARLSTHSPKGMIRPTLSASGMNSAGEIRPCSGWCQRSRASRLFTSPPLPQMMGWYSR